MDSETTNQAAAATTEVSTGAATEVSQGSTAAEVTTTPAKAVAEPRVGLSKEEIGEVVRSAVSTVMPPQQQPQMTQEEIERAFNVYKFDPALVEALGGEERLPVLNAMRDGMVRQALTLAAYQMQQVRDEMMRQFEPALRVAQQYQMEQVRGRFFTKYPDLKDYEPLLVEIKDAMAAQGQTNFKSEEEAFEAVAGRARAILGKLPQRAAQQAVQQRPATTMSTVSSGGQGGVGSTATKASGEASWMSVFK